MKHIPSSSLSDLPSRQSYTQSFLAFAPTDGSAIQASGPFIKPLIPTILNNIYTKLLSYDITAAAFVPKLGRSDASDAEQEPSAPQQLSLDHPHIKRQMGFLRGYLLRLTASSDWTPDSEVWVYMDKVAVMHTGEPGFKHRAARPELRVDYMHMALLLGYVEDIVIGAVMNMEELDSDTKSAVVRAWNKVLWIQNDLFSRHYVRGRGEEVGYPLWKRYTIDTAVALVGGAAMVGLTKLWA